MPSVADELDVPQSARPLIDLLPDAVVDEALPTDAVLRRSLAKVDVDTILNGLNDPSGLEPVLRDAVLKGAEEEISVRVSERLGGQVKLGFP